MIQYIIKKGFPETSESSYRYSLRNNAEERSSQLLRGRSLKSRILCASSAYALRGSITPHRLVSNGLHTRRRTALPESLETELGNIWYSHALLHIVDTVLGLMVLRYYLRS